MKVSVITPFYEGNEYIHEYEEMLSANERSLSTGDVLEVVLINDSPWVSVGLSGLNMSKPNWRVIANKHNVGIHASRIHGLSEASGDYIIFLDQDDRLAEDAIPLLLQEARKLAHDTGQRHCYQVLVANALLEQKDGREIPWYRSKYHESQIANLRTYVSVGTQIISPGQCMMSKEIIPREWMTHVVTVNGADDYYLWLLLLDKGIGFHYVDEPLYIHQYTAHNISSDTGQTDRSTEQFIDYLRETGFSPRFLHTLERQTQYKHDFRRRGLSGKLMLTLRNFDLFLFNVYYKLRTRTPYGFNR